MPRPPKGIYVVGGRVVRFGYRDRATRSGEEFHVITDAAARTLLGETDEFVDLAWNGTTVVRRDQPEIDARLRTEEIAQDNAHFERKQGKAIFLVLLDEINVLRDAAGLPPRTIKQAKSAYKKKLNR